MKSPNWSKAFLLWIVAAAIGFCLGWVLSNIGAQPGCDCNLTVALWTSAAFAAFYLVMVLVAIINKKRSLDQG